MLAAERKNLILEKLQEEKKVVVNELSVLFGVSEETIRRDLDKLDKEGLAIKGYGGAVLNESNSVDMPFSIRKKRNMDGKRKIAAMIAGIVNDGDHVFIDPSTTGVAIASALKVKKRLTVITNSIEVLTELADVSGWDIISTGGTMRENYLALVGARATDSVLSFNADKAIISCKGLDMKKGLTDGNELFSQVKAAMLDSSKTHILAVDYTKFDQVAFSQICDITRIDMVVTDEKPSDEWIAFFRESGIELKYAE